MAKTTTSTKSAKKTTTKKTSEVKAETAPVNAIPAAEEVKVESPKVEMPAMPNVIYANPGDKMMTVIHLYFSRTPVSYGNGKVKVFNNFGDKFSISVREFEQEFAPSSVGSALLKQRILAVCDDCPADVRDRLDLNYKDGEMLNEKQVKAIYEMPQDKVCELFDGLCIEHKKLVVQYFLDDFENGGFHCDRNKIKALNDVSKKYVADGKRGMFADLLEDITHVEEENY